MNAQNCFRLADRGFQFVEAVGAVVGRSGHEVELRGHVADFAIERRVLCDCVGRGAEGLDVDGTLGQSVGQVVQHPGFLSLGHVGREVRERRTSDAGRSLNLPGSRFERIAQTHQARASLGLRDRPDSFTPGVHLALDQLILLADGVQLPLVLDQGRSRVVRAGHPFADGEDDPGDQDARQAADGDPHGACDVRGHEHGAAHQAERAHDHVGACSHGPGQRAAGEQRCPIAVNAADALREGCAHGALRQAHALLLRANEGHLLSHAADGTLEGQHALCGVGHEACQLDGDERLCGKAREVEVFRDLSQNADQLADRLTDGREGLRAVGAVAERGEGLQCLAQGRDETLGQCEACLEDRVLIAPQVRRERVQRTGQLWAKAFRQLVSEFQQVALGRKQFAVRHHLVEFSGGDAHGIGQNVERTWQTVAQLTTDFF